MGRSYLFIMLKVILNSFHKSLCIICLSIEWELRCLFLFSGRWPTKPMLRFDRCWIYSVNILKFNRRLCDLKCPTVRISNQTLNLRVRDTQCWPRKFFLNLKVQQGYPFLVATSGELELNLFIYNRLDYLYKYSSNIFTLELMF